MQEERLDAGQERKTVGAQRRVLGHDHHVVEELVHGGAECREQSQRSGVFTRGEHRLDLARDGEHLLTDPAEQVLGEQVLAVAREVEPMFAERQYTGALKLLAALRKAVDDFFDGVMVMDDDPALRANRLALLARIQSLFLHAADLSRLPG